MFRVRMTKKEIDYENKDRRSWLLRQLLPRSLLDQFSLKQLIHRVRNHLHHNDDMTQLIVARQFIRIFAENTRSFGGKLFPVKFPVGDREACVRVFMDGSVG